MSDWQTRLSDLPGLPADDKLYLEGKLLLIDDVKAARYFKDNEPPEATIKRLRALLPEAGETIDKAHKVHSRGLHREKPGLCLMALNVVAFLYALGTLARAWRADDVSGLASWR